jgi:hypothetical protein
MVLTTIAAVPEPTQTVLPEVVVTEGEEQVEEEIVEMEVHGLDLDVSLVINLILFLNFKIKYFTYLLIIKLIGFGSVRFLRKILEFHCASTSFIFF